MNRKLTLIKLVHTIIWAFYVIVILYIVYSGAFDKVSKLTYAAIGLVVLEGIVLIMFKWRCPLTVLGYKYTDVRETGFDIFIPKWLARHNKTIFGAIFATGLILVVFRIIF